LPRPWRSISSLQDHRYWESHSPLTGRGSWPSAISELCVWQASKALRSPVPVIVSALTAGGGSPQSGFVCLAGQKSLKITGTGYCFRFDGGRWLSAIRLCVSGRPTALTAGPRFTPVQPFPAVKRICVPRAGPARRSMLPFTIAKHVGARPRPVVLPGVGYRP
jgi:hypothetical protein